MKKSITIFFITIINILCITTAFADDLENAKTSAKTELSSIYSLYDEFDYTEANWLELESAYNNGIASIEAAITEEGTYTALNDAAENMISVRHGNKIITACISVENLVLQKGFIIFPEFVKVPKYQPLSKAISRLFENKNPKISQPLIISGTIEKDFQILSAYQGIKTNLDDPDEASVPNYLIKYVGKELPEPVDKTYLNSGDYTQDSCFVYSVNNKFPNVKASAIPVVDEDVIRFQFSIYGKGADVGAATQSSDEPVITPSDKSDLYITFAEIIQKNDIDLLLSNPDNKEKFNDALVVAEMVNVSQLAVDRALKKLRSLEPVTEAPPSSLPDEDKPVETPEEPPTTPPQEEEENEAIIFSDLTDGHFAKDAIDFLSSAGILNGRPDGTFGINDEITRGEFVTILARYENYTNVSELPFEDVDENDWFAAGVSFCFENGITTGKTQTEFDPNAPVTRQEIATMLYRFMKFKGITTEGESKLSFTDADTIAPYAKDAVEALKNMGVINGKDNNCFAPFETATRAETAKMFYNVIK